MKTKCLYLQDKTISNSEIKVQIMRLKLMQLIENQYRSCFSINT